MNGGDSRTSAFWSPGIDTMCLSTMSWRSEVASARALSSSLAAGTLSCDMIRATAAAMGRLGSSTRTAFSNAAVLRARSASPIFCSWSMVTSRSSLSASMRRKSFSPSA